MTVSIIRFGGSNCDRDAEQALEHLEIDAEIVWHEDGLPAETSGIILPGGFSYGDYLRAGAMAARSPIMNEVREAAAAPDGVESAELELVWSPSWSLDMVTEQGKADLREFGLSV